MTTMIVIAFALAAVGVFWTVARNRSKQSHNQVRPVDVQALRTLLDRDDELFLRENLPNRRFRHLKRHRIRGTVRDVGRGADNAAVILRFGETGRVNPGPEEARAAGHGPGLAAPI